MTDLDQRVREAYDAQRLPDDVRARTLSYIEAVRTEHEAAATSVSAASPEASPRFPSTATANEYPRCTDAATPGDREAAPAKAVARPSRRAPRRRPVWLAAAACLLLALAAFGAYGVYQTPSAYVDIDVNPAIELTVNPFGIVIDAEALNDDGRTVLDAVSVTHRPYAAAIETLMKSEAFSSYATEDGFIDINVVSENDALGESLVAESSEAASSMPCGHACQRADAATREAASAAGLCVGRYRAAQELMELDPSYTLDECASMSMRQLRDHIDACHQESVADKEGEATSGAAGSGYNGNGGHGNGHGAGHGKHRSEGDAVSR